MPFNKSIESEHQKWHNPHSWICARKLILFNDLRESMKILTLIAIFLSNVLPSVGVSAPPRPALYSCTETQPAGHSLITVEVYVDHAFVVVNSPNGRDFKSYTVREVRYRPMAEQPRYQCKNEVPNEYGNHTSISVYEDRIIVEVEESNGTKNVPIQFNIFDTWNGQ